MTNAITQKAENTIKVYGGKIKAKLSVIFFRSEIKHIAYVPALNLVAQGDSEQQAAKRIREVVEIYFRETIQDGTLKEDLKQLGWQLMPYKRNRYQLDDISNLIPEGFNINDSIIRNQSYSIA